MPCIFYQLVQGEALNSIAGVRFPLANERNDEVKSALQSAFVKVSSKSQPCRLCCDFEEISNVEPMRNK